MGIGHLYGLIDTAQQVAQYRITVELAIKAGDKFTQYAAYMNLGGVYFDLGKLDSALILEQAAQELALETNSRKYLGYIFSNIGDIYLKKNKPDSAILFFHKSIATSTEQRDQSDIEYGCFKLSQLFQKQNNPDSGLFYARKTISEMIVSAVYVNSESLNLGIAYRTWLTHIGQKSKLTVP